MAADSAQRRPLVRSFGDGRADGTAELKNLLGDRGANLAEMCLLGIPVPPGFTIVTDVCTAYHRDHRAYPEGLAAEVDAAMARVETAVDAGFGDADRPLLVAVRSGACTSMPGMTDTVLNLGLNDETVEGLAARFGNPRLAYDSYRRFIQAYSAVVLGVELEDVLEGFGKEAGHRHDADLTVEDLKEVVAACKKRVHDELDLPFPQDVNEQLWGAIGAVLASWQNVRAVTHRRLHGIPAEWGTAVNVQAMVFGNLGETSATGVAFTRNPSTGDNGLCGRFLVNAQDEDMAAAMRMPQDNITEAARVAAGDDAPSMEAAMPEAFAELSRIVGILETRYRDMQDLKFKIQDGRLWMLQTRSGRRTTKAALKIAVEMVEEGMLSREEAVLRVEPASLDQLLHPTLDPEEEHDVIGSGLPASPGAACGEMVFDSDEAERMGAAGHRVILVRTETNPGDVHGMHAAQGILTTRGGMTSHAATVARGMGTPCVSGAVGLRIDAERGELVAGDSVLKRGDVITLNGSNGQVMAGEVTMIQPELSGDFARIMGWADEIRSLGVRTNADTPSDARTARKFGAEGIGLCRTEHMFFEADRILAVREMILADTEGERRTALAKLLPMQRGDFIELFKIMSGLPVTIRLLDPPLNEFLPKSDEEIARVADAMDVSLDRMKVRVRELDEFNPMLGHRGCRIAISYPEIAEMQARAIFEAAIEAGRETKEAVIPEVMVPLIASVAEFDAVKDRVDAVAGQVRQETGESLHYLVGTMIELPRAALRAAEIAETAEFFSFGTNDLTQTTFGISRDDSAGFLGEYTSKGILEQDPFVSIDVDGVGELVRIGSERGRSVRPDLKLGICGEHGGDTASVAFCDETGLDYVSCSPFRVPIARLAAAQSAVRRRGDSR